MVRNSGFDLDMSWISHVEVNLPAVNRRAQELKTLRVHSKECEVIWLLKAVSCIDLTTLAGDDTPSNVQQLCYNAVNPINPDILARYNVNPEELTVGAVCVYPARVPDCVKTLARLGSSKINVASVATGFPSGQYPLKTRLEEIQQAVADGANEIDIVINRTYVLTGHWKGLYDEIRQMRLACGDAHMKTILATGELGSMANIYRASMIAMMAGSDFIKTSTGKENVNATIPVGIVMARAIREYYFRTNQKIGFKPAGGIKTASDALLWLVMIKEELGDDWLNSNLFRFGASSLLGEVEQRLAQLSLDTSF